MDSGSFPPSSLERATIMALTLCDFAQIREGLLFIASGGVTRLYRPELPAVLGPLTLATIVEIAPTELDKAHEIHVRIRHVESASELLTVTGAMTAPAAGGGVYEPGESATIPLAVPLPPNAPLHLYGAYDLSASIDGGASARLTFYVKPTPRPAA